MGFAGSVVRSVGIQGVAKHFKAFQRHLLCLRRFKLGFWKLRRHTGMFYGVSRGWGGLLDSVAF